MGTITLTSIASGDQINAEPLQNNFNTIKNEMNGGIDADNLEANAVTTAKINDLAVTTAKLSANASTNITAKARAYRATNQTGLVSGTPTRISLDTESYDPGSNFNNGTYRFTAPVTGIYAVSFMVTIVTPVDQAILQIDVQKNGADLIRVSGAASGASNQGVQGSDIVSLTASDYLDMLFTHTSGANRDVLGGSTVTFMSVHLISL